MARNAKKTKTEAEHPHLRLVKDPDPSTEKDSPKKFKSKFAEQLNSFADGLDAEIELIKSW